MLYVQSICSIIEYVRTCLIHISPTDAAIALTILSYQKFVDFQTPDFGRRFFKRDLMIQILRVNNFQCQYSLYYIAYLGTCGADIGDLLSV